MVTTVERGGWEWKLESLHASENSLSSVSTASATLSLLDSCEVIIPTIVAGRGIGVVLVGYMAGGALFPFAVLLNGLPISCFTQGLLCNPEGLVSMPPHLILLQVGGGCMYTSIVG